MPLSGSTSSSTQLRRVASGNFLSQSVLKHSIIFQEGQKGDAAYILVRGKIEISGIIEGKKKVFAMLTPVSIFGEMALFLEDQGRTATAIATEDSEVIVVSKDDLDNFMATAPKVITSIITVLVSRLKSTTKRAMTCPNPPTATVRMLDLLSRNGIEEVDKARTIKHIAETLSTRAENVEAYIDNLQNIGLVEYVDTLRNKQAIRFKERALYSALLNHQKALAETKQG